MRIALLLFWILTLPGPLSAQAGPKSSPETPITATGAGVLRWSDVAGKDRLHAGGWLGLVYAGRLTVGGGGVALLERVELDEGQAGSGFDLGMGYGGLVLRFTAPVSEVFSFDLGLLVGAGHAEVSDRFTGLEAGSDNFPVAEPDLSLSARLRPHLRLGLSAGYRIVWGVEDLPRVRAEDLRSPSGSVFLQLGGL